MSDDEQEQLQLKEREFKLKQSEFKLKEHEFKRDGLKNIFTVITIFGSAVFALFTYWTQVQLQKQAAKDSLQLQRQVALDTFQLKAAEIAMTGRGSFDAKGRIDALVALFPGKLPTPENFDPAKHNWGRSSKSELLDLLAAAPNSEHRRAIVRAYAAILPNDDAIKSLLKAEKQNNKASDRLRRRRKSIVRS